MMRKFILAVALALGLAPLAWASGAITLTATTDSLEVATTTTAATDYRCSWVDNTSTTFTPGASNGQITTATDTTIVAAPGASTQRKISGCSIYAAGSQTVTVQFDQSGTERIMYVATLEAGWSLQWNEESRFEVYDGTGVVVASYAEDTATAAGERVTMAGVVRDGTPGSLVGADLDRTVMQVDDSGRLWVNGSGVTQPISAASLPLPTGAATAANQLPDGHNVTVDNAAGAAAVNVQDGGNTLTVDGTVTVTDGVGALNVIVDSGSVTAVGSAADGAAVSGNPVLVAGQDGTNAQSLKTDTTGSLQVDIESAPTLTVSDGAGAMNVIIDSSATIAVDTTSADQVTPVGAAADGAAVSGNPILIAGQDGTNVQSIKTDTTGSIQVDVETMPTTTVTATNLDVQIGGSDTVTVSATNLDVQIGGSDTVTVTATNLSTNQAQRGGTTIVAGACERETVLYIQISQTTGTQLITGTASERIYICSLQLMTATAQNVALVDGTGSVCATSPTGLLGGSTAATGWNFAANGGIVLPTTRDSWAKTSTDADNVCLLQSSTGQISGSLTYVSIPNV